MTDLTRRVNETAVEKSRRFELPNGKDAETRCEDSARYLNVTQFTSRDRIVM